MASSDTWLWIVFGFLTFLSLIVLGFSYFLTIKNIETHNNELLYPFVGILGKGNMLLTKNGQPQIQCPVGKKARILGAYFEVYDPYLECVVDPNAQNGGASPQFQKTCSQIANESQCGSGGCSTLGSCCECNSSGCSVTSDSPSASCECAHTDPSKGYQNCACSNYAGNNPNDCKSRDASAYISALCDGRNSCVISLDTESGDEALTSVLGPYPCNISVNDPKYKTLPMVRGNDGLGGNSPTLMNQGYYLHGVYSCE